MQYLRPHDDKVISWIEERTQCGASSGLSQTRSEIMATRGYMLPVEVFKLQP